MNSHLLTVEKDYLHAPILVVDDDGFYRDFVRKTLTTNGYTDVQCLESAETAQLYMLATPPALVVLDINMEGMSGLECCEWMRTQPTLLHLPVLMLTGMAQEALRYESFKVGATDFVNKPIHPQELCARVRVHVQNQILLQHLSQFKARLDMELQSAFELQTAILPSQADITSITDQCGVALASYVKMCSEIGGDFWGIKPLDNKQLAVWMADFSGHGVAAAMNAFRLQSIVKEPHEAAAQAGDYLSYANDKLLQSFLCGHFATMFYGVLSMEDKQLHYATACSPHPFILRASGEVEQIDGSGVPLGITTQKYRARTTRFAAGDSLMLYSDALIETPNAQGDFLSEDDIAKLLTSCAGASAETIKEKILQRFFEHSQSVLKDDLTLCVYQYRE